MRGAEFAEPHARACAACMQVRLDAETAARQQREQELAAAQEELVAEQEAEQVKRQFLRAQDTVEEEQSVVMRMRVRLAACPVTLRAAAIPRYLEPRAEGDRTAGRQAAERGDGERVFEERERADPGGCGEPERRAGGDTRSACGRAVGRDCAARTLRANPGTAADGAGSHPGAGACTQPRSPLLPPSLFTAAHSRFTRSGSPQCVRRLQRASRLMRHAGSPRGLRLSQWVRESVHARSIPLQCMPWARIPAQGPPHRCACAGGSCSGLGAACRGAGQGRWQGGGQGG
jgi:hypothetical protein